MSNINNDLKRWLGRSFTQAEILEILDFCMTRLK
jgi:hypothetical protein